MPFFICLSTYFVASHASSHVGLLWNVQEATLLQLVAQLWRRQGETKESDMSNEEKGPKWLFRVYRG